MQDRVLKYPFEGKYAHLNDIPAMFAKDERILVQKEHEYECSWKKHGGFSAFFNLERKWDRLVAQARRCHFDLFAAVMQDNRPEGILDDIGDLRRYLALVEAEARRLLGQEELPIFGNSAVKTLPPLQDQYKCAHAPCGYSTQQVSEARYHQQVTDHIMTYHPSSDRNPTAKIGSDDPIDSSRS